MRLHVFLSRAGVASRRAGARLLSEGRVGGNGGVITEAGTKVVEGDEVRVDGALAALEETKRYVLLNKPAGYVCTLSDEKERPTAASILSSRFSERLYNVGRLDMYSSGIIIFTNDGDFALRVSHPSSRIEKEYIAETTAPRPRSLCAAYQKGIRIDNVFYKALRAEEITPRTARFILTEGKNREIRRVFAHFDCPLKRLTRVRIAALRVNGLREGCFRELTPKEIAELLGGLVHGNDVSSTELQSGEGSPLD
jgi:23S rRNA pseudouridine2605 synthase